MKPTYSGFEAKKQSNFAQLPPPGAYVAEIQGVKTEESFDHTREVIVLMLEITEGEYKGQYHKVFEDQKNGFGDSVKYRGTLRLTPFMDGDESWVKSRFEGNIWCIMQDNPGFEWDWDEKKLKGKKVGISVRKRLYTGQDKDGNPVDRETLEIGRFETVADVKAGKVKPMKVKDTRKNKSESTSGSDFTDVSKDVEVPFPTW